MGACIHTPPPTSSSGLRSVDAGEGGGVQSARGGGGCSMPAINRSNDLTCSLFSMWLPAHLVLSMAKRTCLNKHMFLGMAAGAWEDRPAQSLEPP